jgi:hypothetical protein
LACGAVVSIIATCSVDAAHPVTTDISTGAAVVVVIVEIDAGIATHRKIRRACAADPFDAVRGSSRTDVAASPAVGVVKVEIGTTTVTTGQALRAAVVSTGSAVRVRQEVVALAAATRRLATHIAAARSADAAGVVVARMADREALRLLLVVATPAEGNARVLHMPASP